jgi:hypothetical protein
MMDPNKALEDAREAVEVLNADTSTAARVMDAYEKLHASFEALDGWLSKGGFLPDAWCNGGQRL